jgi:hypothetical protein
VIYIAAFLQNILPMLTDIVIYGAMAIIYLAAILKCLLPLLRNTGSLRHASHVLRESNRMKLARPVWSEVSFLGKAIQNEWRAYLMNAEMMDPFGQPCSVEEHINEDTVIHIPGSSQFADVVPGLFTSLGILGTFIGLVMGLNGISMSEMEITINRLISGLGVAFFTSIAGLACSLTFNIIYRIISGRARKSIDVFVEDFYKYASTRPVDAANQLVSLQQQVMSLQNFTADLGKQLSGEIEKAVARALAPVAVSMDKFLEGTTRQQLEGVRHIVNQFVMAMDQSLSGQLRKLGEAIDQTVRQQQLLREDMRQAGSIISAHTNDSEAMQRVARQVLTHFDGYVTLLSDRSTELEDKSRATTELMTRLHNAAAEQADYLAQLREHQEALEKYLMDYNIWMRGFTETIGGYSKGQRETLSAVSNDIRDGAELLQNSYHSFTENIQDGLSGALGMFDESVQRQAGRIISAIDSLSRVPMPRAGTSFDDGKLTDEIRVLTSSIKELVAQLDGIGVERKVDAS